MGKLLLTVSAFTLASAGWLAMMELALRRPAYVGRFEIDVVIGLICVATILARTLHVGYRPERWLWLGAAVLIGLGAQAFFRNASAGHFEGFVMVISLLLVAQGLLMLCAIGWANRHS